MQQTQSTMTAAAYALSSIYSLEDFQKRHTDKLTLNQLKWLLRFRDRNGLSASGAVLLIARKFYINEPLFAAWFSNQKA